MEKRQKLARVVEKNNKNEQSNNYPWKIKGYEYKESLLMKLLKKFLKNLGGK